jgi:hypothetical protein
VDKGPQRSAARPAARPAPKRAAPPGGNPAAKPAAPRAARAGAAPAGLGKALFGAAGRQRGRGVSFPWRATAIYAGVVVLAAVGLFLWDRAYEAQFAPPSPEALARILVQSRLGAGSVESVRWDRKTDTLSMQVKDVVTDPKHTAAENRKTLSEEGTVAANLILRAISFKHVVLTIDKDRKVEATVRAEPGNGKTPQVEFAPGVP